MMAQKENHNQRLIVSLARYSLPRQNRLTQKKLNRKSAFGNLDGIDRIIVQAAPNPQMIVAQNCLQSGRGGEMIQDINCAVAGQILNPNPDIPHDD
jgi:hypothetical protein